VDQLTEPAGIVALAAAAVALLALVVATLGVLRLRRMRAAQRIVLGGAGTDVVSHAATLQAAFAELHGWVEEIAERLELRMSAAEHRLDNAIAYRAVVRYDAYAELAGNQSMSVALLDAERNGLVLTAITQRDTARFYVRQVVGGEGEQELSPEEAEAIRLALAGTPRSVTL
jgi:hypothetical protein